MSCGGGGGGGGGESSDAGRRSRVADSSAAEIDERLLIDPKLLFVGSKIGEGAHGKVYRGKYCGQTVAIKVLNRGHTLEERATLGARFIREVNMMSRVKHENLVEFIGACKSPFMVIATELLPGMSLKKYLSSIRPKQLELDVAISFALDIAHAMDCLHSNGIIHRDLKPDNLLLTANEKKVKLADFGLAREETVTEMMTAATGTYRWMAPEQVRPPIPDDTPPELASIVQSCWVEEPSLRPSFTQIIRMLNSFHSTLQPSTPHSSTVPILMSSGRGTITTASSFRIGWKLPCLRQFFAAKRTGNSR